MEIVGYPNYIISDKGEIYNKRGRLMKQRINTNGYFHIGLRNGGEKQTQLLIHRLLFQAFKLKAGKTMPEMIDHANGIRTDNSLGNLREATCSQNNMNTVKYKNNKSGHKNIRITPDGTIMVRIRIGKDIKRYYKSFKTLEEAIEHRDIKLLEFHGEFANNGNQIVDEIIAGSTGSTEVLNLL